MADENKTAPVQGFSHRIPWEMHLRAYDAYCKLHREQPALIQGGCRGGFGVNELDRFIPGWRDEFLTIKRQEKEIELLREALRRYGEKGRMGTVEPIELQQAIDRALGGTSA